MPNRKIVVGFSGGVTSAWCAGWALRNFPRDEVVLLFCDTKEEDPDTCVIRIGAPSFQISDPAHGPVNGRGSKGPDNEAIPLCRYHHEEQHRLGWPAFESKYGFSREKEAAAHYAAFLLTGRL